MAAHDLHEVAFEWPHPEPTSVIVTGTFDLWSCSVPLTRTPTGFVGTTRIPWGEKIKFKYVVDGKWVLHENQATETDPGGFVNHFYIAPPAPPAEEAPSTALSPEQTADTQVADSAEPAADKEPVVNGHVQNGDIAVAESGELPAEEVDEAPAVETTQEVKNKADSEPNASAIHPAGYPQFLSDIADTIAARDGTSSTLGYVASGLGAAIHSVVGVDPINNHQIAIPTPKPEDAFTVPGGPESAPNSAALPAEFTSTHTVDPEAPEPLASPIAPIVPILIVPVNAAENNTVASSESEPIASPPVTVTEVVTPPEAAPETAVAPGEAATIADDQLIAKPIVPQAEAAVEPALAVSDTPTEQTISKKEAIAPAPVNVEEVASSEPEPTVSVEPVAEETAPVSESGPIAIETKEEGVLQAEPEIAAAVEKPSADVKTDEVSTAERELAPAPTIEETPTEAPAPEPFSTPAADDLVAEVRAEALAQIPAEPIKVKAEEPISEAAVSTAEPVQEGLTVPKVDELAVTEPEFDSVTEAVKEEEPIPSKPVVEQTPVPEPTVATAEPTTVLDERPAAEIEVVVAGAIVEEQPEEEEPIVPEPVVEDVHVKEEETAAPTPSNGESVVASKVEEPSAVDVAPTGAVEEPPSEVPTIEDLVTEVKAEGTLQETLIAAGTATEEPAIGIEEETTEVPEETAITEPISESVSEPTSAVVVPVPEPPVTVVEDKAPEEPSSVPEVSQIITENSNPQRVEETEAVVETTPEPVIEAPTEVVGAKSISAAEIPAAEPVPVKEPSVTQPIPIASEPSTDSTVDQPSSNGHATAVAAEPTTPSKEKKNFPSSSESAAASADNSPSSSKFNTMRKKRTSILGKLKNIFHSDKEKEKEKK